MVSIASLTLATLGSWTYAGFLADPQPTTSNPATPLTPTSLPEPQGDLPPPSSTIESEVFPPIETSRPTKPEAKPPNSPVSPLLATQYRMADLGGQVWEHPDPTWLQAFIFDRNRRFFGSR